MQQTKVEISYQDEISSNIGENSLTHFIIKVAFCNSCIYTEAIFSCRTIKSSEKIGQLYKHLHALLDE